jgi:hypothetical protein
MRRLLIYTLYAVSLISLLYTPLFRPPSASIFYKTPIYIPKEEKNDYNQKIEFIKGQSFCTIRYMRMGKSLQKDIVSRL